MKKFTVPCDFGGKKAPFDIYIGMPKAGHHPLQNQAGWLAKERGGQIPQEVMESFAKLLDLSIKNNVSFEELCVYALDQAKQQKGENSEQAPTEQPQNVQMNPVELQMGTGEETTEEDA